MTDGRPAGITILDVRHASRVTAIPTVAGPARLRAAGLAGAMEASGLPVEVVDVALSDGDPPGEVAESFAIADRVAHAVGDALARERAAVVLSGSCHAGLGSLSGIPAGGRGVIWLDCHPDFNTPETTESGLLDGMTLATITGRCWEHMASRVTGFSPVRDDRVVLVGARSLDDGETALLERSGVVRIAARDAATRAGDAFRALGQRTDGVCLHLDLDVLDPSVGRANAYVTAGGLSRSDLRGVVEAAVASCDLRVVTFASYDPSADEEAGVCEAALEVAGAFAARKAGRLGG